MYYWYGRLSNIALIFEPIPDDSYKPNKLIRLEQWEDEDV